MPRTTRPSLLALLTITALTLMACGAPPTPVQPDGSGAPAPATVEPLELGFAEAALRPKLEPAGRDLLAVVAPEEWIEATLDVGDVELATSLAVARGLGVERVNAETVLVVGLRNDVIVFAATIGPTRIEVMADQRPDRWLPERMPLVAPMNPGFPYRVAPLGVDRRPLRMTADHQAALLGELAKGITTIGGQPYDRLTVTGDCDPGATPVCMIQAAGVTNGAGGMPDQWMVVSNETTGGEPQLEWSGLQSIPRDLARAAEWIARHDPAALAAIAEYRNCCSATWDPDRAGVITMSWTRTCGAAIAPTGRSIAATGDCFNSLEIVVDVGRTAVLSIERRPGP